MTMSGAVHPPRDEHPINERAAILAQLRSLLRSRSSAEYAPGRETFEVLVMETIEDLLDAATAHDWDEVGAVDLDSSEGEWRVALRLSRDANLRGYGCARGRARGWR